MSHRIFIVEDHPAMRQSYALVLEQEADLELCGMAESAEEALGKFNEMHCDLVVVDVMLPGMDGIELVEHLLRRQPDLPVLVISGHSEELLGERARMAGARAYLSKYKLAATLTGTIREALAEGNPHRRREPPPPKGTPTAEGNPHRRREPPPPKGTPTAEGNPHRRREPPPPKGTPTAEGNPHRRREPPPPKGTPTAEGNPHRRREPPPPKGTPTAERRKHVDPTPQT